MKLLSYLVHKELEYRLLQNGTTLKVEIENKSGQKATAEIKNVDFLTFAPRLNPLSKDSSSKLAVSYKLSSGDTYQTQLYTYSSSGNSLTEAGSAYSHPGKVFDVNVCGSVNRESLCVIYEESGKVKAQKLSANGRISTRGNAKTLSGISSPKAVSSAVVNLSDFLVLAKSTGGLKMGYGQGSSISMSSFNVTGGPDAGKVDKISVNACRKDKFSAIVTTTDGEIYYFPSSAGKISNTGTKIASGLGSISELRVNPDYSSGPNVSKFNAFVTRNDGSVKKVSFGITGSTCAKSGSVTVADEVTPRPPTTTTTTTLPPTTAALPTTTTPPPTTAPTTTTTTLPPTTAPTTTTTTLPPTTAALPTTTTLPPTTAPTTTTTTLPPTTAPTTTTTTLPPTTAATTTTTTPPPTTAALPTTTTPPPTTAPTTTTTTPPTTTAKATAPTTTTTAATTRTKTKVKTNPSTTKAPRRSTQPKKKSIRHAIQPSSTVTAYVPTGSSITPGSSTALISTNPALNSPLSAGASAALGVCLGVVGIALLLFLYLLCLVLNRRARARRLIRRESLVHLNMEYLLNLSQVNNQGVVEEEVDIGLALQNIEEVGEELNEVEIGLALQNIEEVGEELNEVEIGVALQNIEEGRERETEFR